MRCSFRLNDLVHTSQAVKLTEEEEMAPAAPEDPWAVAPEDRESWVSCLSRDSAEMAFICWVAAMEALVMLDRDSEELLSWD